MQDNIPDPLKRVFSLFIDETSDTVKVLIDYKKEVDLEALAELIKQIIIVTNAA